MHLVESAVNTHRRAIGIGRIRSVGAPKLRTGNQITEPDEVPHRRDGD
jgi:hypothetical protein